MARPERLIDKVFDNFALSSPSRSFFVYDLRGDYARWSQGAAIYFDLPGEYLSSANAFFEKHIHPDDLAAYRTGMQNVRKGAQPRYAASYRVMDKSGEYVTCDFRAFIIRDYANQPAYIGVSVANRGHNAQMDTVTGLPGRYAFLNDARDRKEYKRAYIAVMLGTTNFATINRLYGYETGNKVLKELSDIITKELGGKGRAYRAQGAAILLLTERMSPDEVRSMFTPIRTRVRAGVLVQGTRVALELAGGAVIHDDFEVDEHTILTCARYALDQSAATHGRNFVMIKNDQIGERNNTLKIISAMRESIGKGCEGFYLCYQPLVSSQTAMLEGVEVLLRYEKAPFGKVSPTIFMPALEKDEVFPRLGSWIIEQACREGKELLGIFSDLMMHVNLDYVQLEEARFRHTLMDILKRTGFPGKNLCFELTENCKQLSPMFLKDEVFFLKSCGIKTALDGSCMTSLDLLRNLPVDMVKVDKDMINGIEKNPADQYMLEAVTGFARKMNIQVCIEGVETEATKNFLRKYPVSAYQGFYYSEPVRLSDLKKLPLFRVSAT